MPIKSAQSVVKEHMNTFRLSLVRGGVHPTFIMIIGYKKDSKGGSELFRKINPNVAVFPKRLTVRKGVNILT